MVFTSVSNPSKSRSFCLKIVLMGRVTLTCFVLIVFLNVAFISSDLSFVDSRIERSAVKLSEEKVFCFFGLITFPSELSSACLFFNGCDFAGS